jgi:hypothetical protein
MKNISYISILTKVRIYRYILVNGFNITNNGILIRDAAATTCG